MLIRRPVAEVFEAFVDPAVTSQFWFTDGSGRLEAGRRVTWRWRMYGASVQVDVKAVEPNRRILVEWSGEGESPTAVELLFTARRRHHVSPHRELGLPRGSGGRRAAGGRLHRGLRAGAVRAQGVARARARAGARRRPLSAGDRSLRVKLTLFVNPEQPPGDPLARRFAEHGDPGSGCRSARCCARSSSSRSACCRFWRATSAELRAAVRLTRPGRRGPLRPVVPRGPGSRKRLICQGVRVALPLQPQLLNCASRVGSKGPRGADGRSES